MEKIMSKKYNQVEIEKKIEAIWHELEPKIVKEICKEYKTHPNCESKSLDEIHMGMGFCHVIWRIQKKVLKCDNEINWRSPGDLNPEIMYD